MSKSKKYDYCPEDAHLHFAEALLRKMDSEKECENFRKKTENTAELANKKAKKEEPLEEYNHEDDLEISRLFRMWAFGPTPFGRGIFYRYFGSVLVIVLLFYIFCKFFTNLSNPE